jgi:hypothetical protein
MYGKLDGKSNMVNKYDWPPPVDNQLYFGSCCLVGMLRDHDNNKVLTNLSLELWNKIYEKLFGGFEDLSATIIEDENEIDELENIPKHKKTKNGGYLKDGFVVDSEEETSDILSSSSEQEEEEEDEDEEEEIEIVKKTKQKKTKKIHKELEKTDETDVDISTELVEEPFSDEE